MVQRTMSVTPGVCVCVHVNTPQDVSLATQHCSAQLTRLFLPWSAFKMSKITFSPRSKKGFNFDGFTFMNSSTLCPSCCSLVETDKYVHVIFKYICLHWYRRKQI